MLLFIQKRKTLSMKIMAISNIKNTSNVKRKTTINFSSHNSVKKPYSINKKRAKTIANTIIGTSILVAAIAVGIKKGIFKKLTSVIKRPTESFYDDFTIMANKEMETTKITSEKSTFKEITRIVETENEKRPNTINLKKESDIATKEAKRKKDLAIEQERLLNEQIAIDAILDTEESFFTRPLRHNEGIDSRLNRADSSGIEDIIGKSSSSDSKISKYLEELKTQESETNYHTKSDPFLSGLNQKQESMDDILFGRSGLNSADDFVDDATDYYDAADDFFGF